MAKNEMSGLLYDPRVAIGTGRNEVIRELTYLDGGACVVTLRGTRSGPTLALLGGVHGDEDEGVLAVHRVLDLVSEATLCGTLRALAPAHPSAWAAHCRTSPLDGGNLARSFPGEAGGGPTASLAASITERVLSGADLLIDLHSAGLRYSMPLMCGYIDGTPACEVARRAALAFDAPVIWKHLDSPPGRTLSAAADLGIPAIYAECSGGAGILADELDVYVTGVLAVLEELGMVPETFRREPRHQSRWVFGRGDLDAGVQSKHDGFFVSGTAAGAVLASGDVIGEVYRYDGRLLEVVEAPHDGMVMFLRRQARVRAGDALFALASLEEAGR